MFSGNTGLVQEAGTASAYNSKQRLASLPGWCPPGVVTKLSGA
jgi:hypothetical protein